MVIKFLTVSEPRPDGHRTVFFELNGQPREVDIHDKSLRKEVAAPKPTQISPVTSVPRFRELVSSVMVELNQQVAKGDRLLMMGAIENRLRAGERTSHSDPGAGWA